MVVIQEGRVEGGRLVLPETVRLPDGTIVRVSIEVMEPGGEQVEPRDDVDFAAEPFFGVWADREDMRDSADWVTKQRDAWQDRLSRAD